VIERLRRFASGPPPDAFEAAALLRLVYLAVFGGQVLLALVVGALLAVLVPGRGTANDIVAAVLLAMAFFHLPLGWLLGRTAVRAGGRQGALSGIIAAAVLFSIPAWFGVLLLVSGQRPVYLMAVAAVVSIGYALGFVLTGVAARVSVADTPPGDAPHSVAAHVSAADTPPSDEPHSVAPAPDQESPS